MSNVPVVTAPAAKVKEHKLSLKEKVSYGFGDFGNGFMFDLGQIYLLKFFTDVAGIPAPFAGSIFLVSKLFAALTDPIVGSAIDYRKKIGPRGKFRPYLLFGSIILAVMTVLIFVSPDVSVTWKLVYAYASYMLWGGRLFFRQYSVRLPRRGHYTGCGGQNGAFRVPPDRLPRRVAHYKCHRHPDSCSF